MDSDNELAPAESQYEDIFKQAQKEIKGDGQRNHLLIPQTYANVKSLPREQRVKSDVSHLQQCVWGAPSTGDDLVTEHIKSLQTPWCVLEGVGVSLSTIGSSELSVSKRTKFLENKEKHGNLKEPNLQPENLFECDMTSSRVAMLKRTRSDAETEGKKKLKGLFPAEDAKIPQTKEEGTDSTSHGLDLKVQHVPAFLYKDPSCPTQSTSSALGSNKSNGASGLRFGQRSKDDLTIKKTGKVDKANTSEGGRSKSVSGRVERGGSLQHLADEMRATIRQAGLTVAKENAAGQFKAGNGSQVQVLQEVYDEDSEGVNYLGAAREKLKSLPGLYESFVPSNSTASVLATLRATGSETSVARSLAQSSDSGFATATLEGPPGENFGLRFMVNFDDLRFETAVFEPLLVEAFLCDVEQGCRVSETIRFEMGNTPTASIRSLVAASWGEISVDYNFRRALFAVSYPNPGVHLVVRVSRILDGSVQDATDIYGKIAGGDVKLLDKQHRNTTEKCKRLGPYRMPFAWSALKLFENHGVLILGDDQESRKADLPLYMCETNRNGFLGMLKNLVDLDGKKSNKLQKVPGKVQITILPIAEGVRPKHGRDSVLREIIPREDERVSNRMDATASFVNGKAIGAPKPAQMNFRQDSDASMFQDDFDEKKPAANLTKRVLAASVASVVTDSPYREVMEFPVAPVYVPHNSFLHHMYVYPMKVDLSSRTGAKARNLVCKVLLRKTDDFDLSKDFKSNMPGVSNGAESDRESAITTAETIKSRGEDAASYLPAALALEGEQCIFNEHSGTSPFKSSQYSTGMYHEKSPEFMDEIKLQLPANWEEKYHLLFVFGHVAVKARKNDTVFQPAAYTWLKLDDALMLELQSAPSGDTGDSLTVGSAGTLRPDMSTISESGAGRKTHKREKSGLKSGLSHFKSKKAATQISERLAAEFSLPVYTDLPKNYLSQPQHSLKPLEQGRGLFTVMTRISSTVLPLDERIRELMEFASFSPAEQEEDLTAARQIFEGLLAADGEQVVGHMNTLLDHLLGMVTRPTPKGEVSKLGFEYLIKLTMRYHRLMDDGLQQNLWLAAYVKYHFTEDPAKTAQAGVNNDQRRAVYEEVLKSIAIIMDNDESFLQEFLTVAWFFNQLVTKSLTIHLQHQKKLPKLPSTDGNADRITDYIQGCIENVLEGYFGNIKRFSQKGFARRLNEASGVFMRDLLLFTNRTFIFRKIRSYLQTLTVSDAPVLQEFKVEFLAIFCLDENYMHYNLPLKSRIDVTSSQSSVASKDFKGVTTTAGGFGEHHALSALLIWECRQLMHSKHKSAQQLMIGLLGKLLSRLESDPRYAGDYAVQQRIAAVHFPILEMVCGVVHRLCPLDQAGKRLSQELPIPLLDDEETVSPANSNNNLTVVTIQEEPSQSPREPSSTGLSPSGLRRVMSRKPKSETVTSLNTGGTPSPPVTDGSEPATPDSLAVANGTNSAKPAVPVRTTSRSDLSRTVGSPSSKLDFQITRGLLVAACWVLRNADPQLTSLWISTLSDDVLIQFQAVMALTLTNVNYVGADALKSMFSKASSSRWDKGMRGTEKMKKAFEERYTNVGKGTVGRHLGYAVYGRSSSEAMKGLPLRSTLRIDATTVLKAVSECTKRKGGRETPTVDTSVFVGTLGGYGATRLSSMLANYGNSSEDTRRSSVQETINSVKLQQIMGESSMFFGQKSDEQNDTEAEQKAQQEATLSTTCTLLVLAMVDTMLVDYRPLLSQAMSNWTRVGGMRNFTSSVNISGPAHHSPSHSSSLALGASNERTLGGSVDVYEAILAILNTALVASPSELSLCCALSTVRGLAVLYPQSLFRGKPEFCSLLVMRVLQSGNSVLHTLRVEAASVLYFLLRQNWIYSSKDRYFSHKKTMARVKMQITIALSRLAGGQKDGGKALENEDALRLVFALMDHYAENDTALRGQLAGGNNSTVERAHSPRRFGLGSPRKASDGASVAKAGGASEDNAGTFSQQIFTLLVRLYSILKDTVKMRLLGSHQTQVADLQYRIAKGYANTPDLRITWLENLANLHREIGNWSEAAMCYAHIGALVAEHMDDVIALSIKQDEKLKEAAAGASLTKLRRSSGTPASSTTNIVKMSSAASVPSLAAAAVIDPYGSYFHKTTRVPRDCRAFMRITPNCLMERRKTTDSGDNDPENAMQHSYFSIDGIIKVIKRMSSYLKKAELFELVTEANKLLLPIFEERRDYGELEQIYADQMASCRIILTLEGRRVFNTYYRVTFYGKGFGTRLHGKDFVYRYPKITPLSQVTAQLRTEYSQLHPGADLDIIHGEDEADVANLDVDNKLYIRIIGLEPVPMHPELEGSVVNGGSANARSPDSPRSGEQSVQRKTLFEKNNSLAAFVYTTPFTQAGGKRGETHEQYLRRTIVTMHDTFPYLKTRLDVENVTNTVINPIEAAIESLSKKDTDLVDAMCAVPPDAKRLQLILQGIVGVTVNDGPLHLAKIFLQEHRGQFSSKDLDAFEEAFSSLVMHSEDAVNLNAALIKRDQQAYQEQLANGLSDLQQGFRTLLQQAQNGNGVHSSQDRAVFQKPSQNGVVLDKPIAA
eukprot:Clim_evm7s159 gene=Clim_evmTU7s159